MSVRLTRKEVIGLGVLMGSNESRLEKMNKDEIMKWVHECGFETASWHTIRGIMKDLGIDYVIRRVQGESQGPDRTRHIARILSKTIRAIGADWEGVDCDLKVLGKISSGVAMKDINDYWSSNGGVDV